MLLPDAINPTQPHSRVFGYDNAGNLTSLIHKDDIGDPLVTYGNTFDDNNRITSETRNSVTANYEYDEVNQVVDDDTNEYSYDLNGNRTMTGYTTGTGNRIETDGTWTYEYDLEGNLIKKSMGEEDETWEYGYNHNNQMIWAEKRATDGGTLQLRIDYIYDVFGNLVERTVTVGETETTTRFAYDVSGASIGIDGHINPLWAELDEEGDVAVRFLLGDYVAEKLARSGDNIDTAWLLHDRLGSLREVLDEEGALVNSIAYDAFGDIISETDDDWTGNFAWQGLLLGREEDIHWAKYRGVLSNGQWTGEDLLSFAAGDANLRRVLGNNGVNWTDPSGLSNDVLAGNYYFYWQGYKDTPMALPTLHAVPSVGPDDKYRLRNDLRGGIAKLTCPEIIHLIESFTESAIRRATNSALPFLGDRGHPSELALEREIVRLLSQLYQRQCKNKPAEEDKAVRFTPEQLRRFRERKSQDEIDVIISDGPTINLRQFFAAPNQSLSCHPSNPPAPYTTGEGPRTVDYALLGAAGLPIVITAGAAVGGGSVVTGAVFVGRWSLKIASKALR